MYRVEAPVVAYRLDHKLERDPMCPRNFLLEVEDTYNLVGIIGFQLFRWYFLDTHTGNQTSTYVWYRTNLGIQIRWIWDISNHF